MSDLLPAGEVFLRLGFFLGIFAGMTVWELALPRRPISLPRRVRWPANLGILALNTVLLRLVFPMAATSLALLATSRGWGLLNNLPRTGVPGTGVAIVFSVILLDLAIYLQHVMFHAVPALWRLHRMHHTDVDFDVSTGGRFHPVEILLSMVIKMGLVAAIGPPAAGVVIFEIVLNGTS
ncbi:MAG: sterol desaturase family protein, partial [Myxococcota bacterium]